VREVVPPVVQTEAAVPQKSREQDRRSPSSSDDVTYGPIQKARGEVVTQIADEQDSDFDGDESARDEDGVVAQSANGESEQTSDIDEESNEGSESEGDVSASQQESDNSAQEQAQQAEEQRVISQLQSRDREVRAHEQAHAAIGGAHAGAPSYTYQTGPDGKKYAVGGEVSIDVAPESTPLATIRKMEVVRAAALAPAEPSSQDRKVAAQASMQIAQARSELATARPEPKSKQGDAEGSKQTETKVQASDSERVNEQKTSLTGDIGEHVSSTAQTTKQVIFNRYHSSYRYEEKGFNAVA
jgi:hypothetical protein